LEAADGKGGIIRALIAGTENTDELTREDFHDQQGNEAHQSLPFEQQGKQSFGSVLAPGADVVAHHRDAARRETHCDRDRDLEELHHDAQYGKRDLGVFGLSKYGIERAIFGTHVLNRRHGNDKRDLA